MSDGRDLALIRLAIEVWQTASRPEATAESVSPKTILAKFKAVEISKDNTHGEDYDEFEASNYLVHSLWKEDIT